MFFYFYLLFLGVSFVVVLAVLSRHENPAFKIVWIVAILAFPIFGGIFYVYIAKRNMPTKLEKALLESHLSVHQWLPRGDVHLDDPHHTMQSNYIQRITGYPLCENSSIEYFSSGEDMFADMLSELKHAQHYIFMEYFIVRPGIMWDTIFDLLKQKIKSGIKVYMMYDDVGSIISMPKRIERQIRESGVNLCVFNPIKFHISTMLNSRDHRKIMVIDGKTAFCGGINLADEYINKVERYGHWKDTGVRVKGDAVRSFVLMFLQQWSFAAHEHLPIDNFVTHCEPCKTDGKIHVFDDSPLDSHNITETIYLNAIGHAKHYIYITTPYLVIDYSMMQALCCAALSGVDVRIYTPHRYDKWYVHIITRSNYEWLIRSGVKVYEYTPGFMHAKMLVCDDNICVVGTCNMDFRSFYLHFECSVLMYDCSAVLKVKEDMLACEAVSQEISLEETQKVGLGIRILRSVLRVFSPLM